MQDHDGEDLLDMMAAAVALRMITTKPEMFGLKSAPPPREAVPLALSVMNDPEIRYFMCKTMGVPDSEWLEKAGMTEDQWRELVDQVGRDAGAAHPH
ncbi:hypothetical protein [Sphingobium sp. Cam5-1]|uniref:hypothetical protein n=1 Tax=Sphingobium sp. Cam5-1 TaxID=2789327 RepID=UPI0018AD15AF|nr:hypothetical protein [Sphingobium sp. Cam5-1]QPI73947.1 hypothetical protein IZV00_05640 [Sphingobium sp. Cam5-1]